MLASQRSKDSSMAASLACLTQKDSLTAAYLVRRMVVELAKCLQMVDSRIVLAGSVYMWRKTRIDWGKDIRCTIEFCSCPGDT